MREKELDKFMELIKPGSIIMVDTGNNQPSIDGKYYVLGIFDKYEIAVKSFYEPKNIWIYEFKYAYDFVCFKKSGWITIK